jgi:hypothetical protein
VTGTNPYAPPRSNLEIAPPLGPAPPLWNPDAAGAWSLLFTPVFGSTLVLLNWKAIGDEAQARTARNWLIASIAMLIPSGISGVGLVWIIVWYYAWQRKQSRFIRETWAKDYPHRGWMVPLLCGFGALLGIWLVIFLLTMALPR